MDTPLTQPLPLFPLGLVLYPYERLPLHIFEERYKEMIGRCMDEDIPFGVVLFEEGRLQRVGCTAKVDRVLEQYEDGRLDIVVRGHARFRVGELVQDREYLQAYVEPIAEPPAAADSMLLERAITQHMKLLELAGRTVRPSLYQDVPYVSYVLAQNAGLSAEQKQEVLELATEEQRIEYLISHFEDLIPRIEEMEDVRKKVQSNGHFKDFPPEIQ